MTLRRFGTLACFALLLLCLFFTGYLGLTEGYRAISYADEPGMKVAMVTQIGYGIFAVVSLVALRFKQAWSRVALILWGCCTTTTAGLAPVVYGKQPVMQGVWTGLGTAAVVLLLLWGSSSILEPRSSD